MRGLINVVCLLIACNPRWLQAFYIELLIVPNKWTVYSGKIISNIYHWTI